MSSRVPATITFSLEEFARHGGSTAPHKDGWGIAYYDDGDARLIKEARAAADSACVRFIKDNDLASNLVISHIRRATHGPRALKNTQPFWRELGGRMHIFAHNGMLADVETQPALSLDMSRPIGETDSEHAFCALLRKMQDLWLSGDAQPSMEERLDVVSGFAAVIRELGPANFLYSDGEVLFAHGHRRAQADGNIRPPGLFYLCRSCSAVPRAIEAEGLTISSPAAQQEVVLVASVPLTDEPWMPFEAGELIAVSGGQIVHRSQSDTAAQVAHEGQGHD